MAGGSNVRRDLWERVSPPIKTGWWRKSCSWCFLSCSAYDFIALNHILYKKTTCLRLFVFMVGLGTCICQGSTCMILHGGAQHASQLYCFYVKTCFTDQKTEAGDIKQNSPSNSAWVTKLPYLSKEICSACIGHDVCYTLFATSSDKYSLLFIVIIDFSDRRRQSVLSCAFPEDLALFEPVTWMKFTAMYCWGQNRLVLLGCKKTRLNVCTQSLWQIGKSSLFWVWQLSSLFTPGNSKGVFAVSSQFLYWYQRNESKDLEAPGSMLQLPFHNI